MSDNRTIIARDGAILGLNTARPGSPTASSPMEDLAKIAGMDAGGLDATADSLAYTLKEILRHLHNTPKCYGQSGNTMVEDALGVFSIVAPAGEIYGQEIELHNGATIEGGSAVKKFDLHQMFVLSSTTANRLTNIQFYYGTQSAGVACTFQNAGDTITKAGHGFVGGEKLMFSAGGGALPAELNIYTVYKVVNVVGDTFQVELYTGSGAIVLNSDGTMQYHTLTQTLLTSTYVNVAAVNADSLPLELMCRRVTCSNRVWVRAKAVTGTNTVTVVFELHTYDK